jgi:putative two-component system response regulator
VTESKPVVLVLDDTPANIELLHNILRDDYKIKVATDGTKGLELAARLPRPDIILLDIMMPGISGYEVISRLKENAETSAIPVVFITAKSQVQDEQKGLALGAVDYVTKPFDPEIVKARVHAHVTAHLELRQLVEENRELTARLDRAFSDYSEDSISSLIEGGESGSLEFKSTLRWNLHADRNDKHIENACLKTVAGYLNGDGGMLLVGVDDQGELIGLGKDHFKTEDKMLLHWVNLIKAYLGAGCMRFIRSAVHEISDLRILVVECLPSASPVYFNRDNEECFFIRMGNTTQALKPSELLAYIGQHFPDAS